MDKDILKGNLDDILSALETTSSQTPLSVKDAQGQYVFANEAWGNLAEAVPHKIIGKRDEQLPWGEVHGDLAHLMDVQARSKGKFNVVDRRPHFRGQFWLYTATEKLHLRSQDILISKVNATAEEVFCQLATRVSERGISHNGKSLSIKQLYLLHLLLFHVPQKQSARELHCSTSRINQHYRELREEYEADDNKELLCVLSAHGLFPLLERFELLFRHQWISPELKFE